MLTWSIILFAVAAVGGVTMAVLRLRERPIPMALALAHGVLAATALMMLLVVALGPGGTGLGRTALVIFVVAALGGFYLFSHHVRGRNLPIPVVVIHGLVAVAAFVTLLVAANR